MELSLSFSEAAEGCTKRLSFDAYVFCDSCGEWPQNFLILSLLHLLILTSQSWFARFPVKIIESIDTLNEELLVMVHYYSVAQNGKIKFLKKNSLLEMAL